MGKTIKLPRVRLNHNQVASNRLFISRHKNGDLWITGSFSDGTVVLYRWTDDDTIDVSTKDISEYTFDATTGKIHIRIGCFVGEPGGEALIAELMETDAERTIKSMPRVDDEGFIQLHVRNWNIIKARSRYASSNDRHWQTFTTTPEPDGHEEKMWITAFNITDDDDLAVSIINGLAILWKLKYICGRDGIRVSNVSVFRNGISGPLSPGYYGRRYGPI